MKQLNLFHNFEPVMGNSFLFLLEVFFFFFFGRLSVSGCEFELIEHWGWLVFLKGVSHIAARGGVTVESLADIYVYCILKMIW